VLLAAVGILALVARLVPVLGARALRGSLSYDEGVHLVVAQRLLAGQLTYRDVFFAHPPGIVIAQVPIALLGRLVGEPSALAVSRCVVGGVGALTAVLVARLLLRRGLLAAAAGGVVAALYAPAVAADRVAMLEPALSLALVVAFGALARPGRGPAVGTRGSLATGPLAVGGLAVGLALSVKLWAALDVVVLTAVVAARFGRVAVLRWCAWTAVGTLVVVGPFLVLAPGALWRDVVQAQVSRPRTGGLGSAHASVAAAADTVTRPGTSWTVGAFVVLGALAVVALVLVVRARVRPWGVLVPASWPDPVWWAVVGLVHLVALVVAPSYYLHYSAFLTVPIALVAGAVAGRLVRRARARVPVAVAVAVLAALLVVDLPAVPPGARVDNDLLAAEAAGGCVWAREVELLVLADASRRQIDESCPGRADLYGERMATSLAPDGAAAVDELDGQVVGELAASHAVLLLSSNPYQGLGPRARSYLDMHFTATVTTGRVEVWRRRP